MTIVNIRHAWPEHGGFRIDRPKGCPEYVFLHFWNPMHLRCGKDTIVTAPNTCIVYTPDTPQWFASDRDLIHDWMHIEGDVAGAMAAFGLCPDSLYPLHDGRFVTAIVQELEAEFFARRPYADTLCLGKLQELFLKIARERDEPAAPALNAAVLDRFRQLRTALMLAPEQDWHMPQLAERAYLSESRFYALYKKAFGISPNRDLLLARIERAKALLLRSDEPIAAVAQKAGYANEYHFIRQFKQLTGVTPGQYRRDHKGEMRYAL